MKEIELTRGKVTLVDDYDYPFLMQVKWYALPRHGHWYAATHNPGVGPRTIYMHRIIMDPSSDMVIDHINHNGLDNQRHNLRICTHTENLRNRRPKEH